MNESSVIQLRLKKIITVCRDRVRKKKLLIAMNIVNQSVASKNKRN